MNDPQHDPETQLKTRSEKLVRLPDKQEDRACGNQAGDPQTRPGDEGQTRHDRHDARAKNWQSHLDQNQIPDDDHDEQPTMPAGLRAEPSQNQKDEPGHDPEMQSRNRQQMSKPDATEGLADSIEFLLSLTEQQGGKQCSTLALVVIGQV